MAGSRMQAGLRGRVVWEAPSKTRNWSLALKGRGESRSPTLRESSSPRLLLLTTRKEPELGLVQSEVLKQLWARCQRSAQEARCRAGTVVGGEDDSGGKGGHRKETCDFLCLLGKTATMPDPQQIRNSPRNIRVREEFQRDDPR